LKNSLVCIWAIAEGHGNNIDELQLELCGEKLSGEEVVEIRAALNGIKYDPKVIKGNAS